MRREGEWEEEASPAKEETPIETLSPSIYISTVVKTDVHYRFKVMGPLLICSGVCFLWTASEKNRSVSKNHFYTSILATSNNRGYF